MKSGCYTALITPFRNDLVDYDGLAKLSDFQIANNITGILAAGTTGESPTLAWDEHNKVTEIIAKKSKGNCLCIAGTGSNNTKEALSATKHACDAGVDAILLVDPYYNGPSSIEIRKEYIGPVAKTFPNIEVIPYIIPGRTGAQLLPEDLAILNDTYDNLNSVKEATGNIDNMKRTRKVCGPDFFMYSGDDGMVFDMMTDPEIKANGLISVASNIIPKAVVELIQLIENGDTAEAKTLNERLDPLFNITTVITYEMTPYGETQCRARNPLGVKTLMQILGMPAGGCRQPLGKMTRNGAEYVLEVAKRVQNTTPELFLPIAEFFNVDIEKRLNDPETLEGLFYETL